jgi:ABC-2 type transport system permease protein
MSKLWKVALYEYKRNVFTKGFIAGALSVPLVMILMVGLFFLIDNLQKNNRPLGYVDQASFLTDPIPAPLPVGAAQNSKDAVELISYPSIDDAQKALGQGAIQAYYVIPPDYRQSLQVELYYKKSPGQNATTQFWDFMQINWLKEIPLDQAERAVSGNNIVVHQPDGSLDISSLNPINPFLPMIVTFLFYILILVNSQTMVEAVTKEKENRTMEILITSISPQRLITGKILGILGTVFTLTFIWLFFIFLGVVIGGNLLDITFLQNVAMRPYTAFMLVMVLLPALVIINALAVALGATVVEAQEGQQMSVIIALMFYAPYFVVNLIMEHPESTISMVLSFIPVTAPFTLALRSISISIPWWQLLIGVVGLWLTAAASLWLARRLFSRGLLRYGQRLDWREAFRRTSRSAKGGLAG